MPAAVLPHSIEFQDSDKRLVFFEQSAVQPRIKVTLQTKEPIQDGQTLSGSYRKVAKIDDFTIQSICREGRFLYHADPFELIFLEGKSTRVRTTKRDQEAVVQTTFIETGLFHNDELDIGVMEITPKQNFDEALLDSWFGKSGVVPSSDRKQLTFTERNPSRSVQCIMSSNEPIEIDQRFNGEDFVTIVHRSETRSSVVLSFTRQSTQSGSYIYKGGKDCLLVAGRAEFREYDVAMSKSTTIKEKGFFNPDRQLDSYFMQMDLPKPCVREHVVRNGELQLTTKYESGLFRKDYLVYGVRSHFFMLEDDRSFSATHVFGNFKLLLQNENSSTIDIVCHDEKGRLYQELSDGTIHSYIGLKNGVPEKDSRGVYRQYTKTIVNGYLQRLTCSEINSDKFTPVDLWCLDVDVDRQSFVFSDLSSSGERKILDCVREDVISTFRTIEKDLMLLKRLDGAQIVNCDPLGCDVATNKSEPVTEPIGVETRGISPGIEELLLEDKMRKKTRNAIKKEKRQQRHDKKKKLQIVELAERRLAEQKLAQEVLAEQKLIEEKFATEQKLARKKFAEQKLATKRFTENMFAKKTRENQKHSNQRLADQRRAEQITVCPPVALLPDGYGSDAVSSQSMRSELQPSENGDVGVDQQSPDQTIVVLKVSKQTCDVAVQANFLPVQDFLKSQYAYFSRQNGVWIQDASIMMSAINVSMQPEPPRQLAGNNVPHEDVDLTFFYRVGERNERSYVNKWISNRLGEGSSFFMIMNVWDVSPNQFTQVYVASNQRIRRGHEFQGVVEFTRYSINADYSESPIFERRREGIFYSFVDFYDQFSLTPFVLRDGQLTEIYRDFMLVHKVEPQGEIIKALSPVPVKHNAHYSPCFASFFQPAHIQSGAPCPVFDYSM